MLSEKVLIIYNPNSGRGCGERLAQRLKKGLERRGGQVAQIFRSNSCEIVYEFCRDNSGNPEQFTLAVIIGGDGTLSPWVDAMIKHRFSVPIYAFGRGTANDFSAFLGTARSIRRVCNIITRNPSLREFDTLYINDLTYGINVACGGAFTNGVTKYSKKGKRRFGKLAYMWKAAGMAFKMRSQPMKFTVDGTEHTAEVYLFLILNSPNAGSIRRISTTARPWDGELELVAIKRCGFFGKLGLGVRGLFRRLENSPHVLKISGKQFVVETVGEQNPNFTLTDIDGNKGEPYPMQVSVSDEKSLFITVDKHTKRMYNTCT